MLKKIKGYFFNQYNQVLEIKGKIKLSETAIAFAMAVFFITLLSTNVYALDASAGTAQFDAVMAFVSGWLVRIAGVVMLWGVIQFGLSFNSQNPDGKIQALMLMGGAAIVGGAALGYQFFIN